MLGKVSVIIATAGAKTGLHYWEVDVYGVRSTARSFD